MVAEHLSGTLVFHYQENTELQPDFYTEAHAAIFVLQNNCQLFA